MKPYANSVIVLLLSLAIFSHAEKIKERPCDPSLERFNRLLHEHFGEPEEKKSTKPFTLEELKDMDLWDKWFEIDYQLGMLMDTHVLLPDLEWVGIYQSDHNSVNIDQIRHPQWNPISDMFSFVLGPDPDYDFFKAEASQMGIEESEISKYLEYAKKNNYEVFHKNSNLKFFDLMMEYKPKLLMLLDAGKDPRKLVTEIAYERRKGRFKREIERAIEFLEAGSKKSQKILARFWQEGNKTSSMTISGDDFEMEILETITILKSDLLERQFSNAK